MEAGKKRKLFLAAFIGLVVLAVGITVAVLVAGPRDSVVELVSSSGSELVVNDLYQGNMTIPKYSAPINTYNPDQFVERRGVITYEGGTSLVGINVNAQKGDIDWDAVAAGGVDFVMIRAGFRMYQTGKIVPDENFEKNIKGALDAGLPVGVYFYSKAITDAEAEEEASFVLEQIRGYTVTFPVAFYWEYDLTDDGSRDLDSRTVKCNGDQVTGFADAFCKKVKAAGFTPSYYCDKTMGYEELDLSRLAGYEMWYAEFKTVPSFYYAFGMWQYTKEGEVPGFAEGVKVPISLAFKEYGK